MKSTINLYWRRLKAMVEAAPTTSLVVVCVIVWIFYTLFTYHLYMADALQTDSQGNKVPQVVDWLVSGIVAFFATIISCIAVGALIIFLDSDEIRAARRAYHTIEKTEPVIKPLRDRPEIGPENENHL